jgi:hypothetical protein
MSFIVPHSAYCKMLRSLVHPDLYSVTWVRVLSSKPCTEHLGRPSRRFQFEVFGDSGHSISNLHGGEDRPGVHRCGSGAGFARTLPSQVDETDVEDGDPDVTTVVDAVFEDGDGDAGQARPGTKAHST